MNIKKEFRNDLLKRKEVLFIVENSGNPGVQSCLSMVSDKYKVESNVIEIRKINSQFGSNKFQVEAFVYDSEKDKMETEQKKKEKKK